MTPAVGREMMTRYVVPFELAGLLLTAALVGAVVLAQYDNADEADALAESSKKSATTS
jgi:NADH-quinone oxidoreductase subunit J